MYITIASLTINNNTTTFTINSGEDISGISPNSLLFVAGASLPTQVSWENGAPKLIEPWTENNFTAVKARIFVGIQGLVDAVDSAKAVSNNLNTKTDEVNTIIAGQGTAATKDVTTSANDTTYGRLLKVGDYGLGIEDASRTLEDFSGVSLGINGLYRSDANIGVLTNPPPNSPYRESVGMVLNGVNNTQAILHMLCNPSAGNAIWIGAKQQESDSVTWNELFHTGNLNVTEFGGISANKVVAIGFAQQPNQATFYLPINSPVSLSSITVESTFTINRPDFSLVISGIIPANTGSSGNNIAVLTVTGLSGLTTGEPLLLRQETTSSKITVNF